MVGFTTVCIARCSELNPSEFAFEALVSLFCALQYSRLMLLHTVVSLVLTLLILHL